MLAVLGVVIGGIVVAWAPIKPEPSFLRHSPTRLRPGQEYILPVFPAFLGCETELAVACADGDDPCRFDIGGFKFVVEAGTVFRKSFVAQDLRIEGRNFNRSFVRIMDSTPGPCCYKPPWSGSTDPPCRLMAWYETCCVDTMVGCASEWLTFSE